MNKSNLKKIGIILFISLLLSVAIIRTSSQDNVSFCVKTAGCNMQEPEGKVITRSYGYPTTYKQVSLFEPANNDESSVDYAGYAEASVTVQDLNVANIVINTTFWFALLHFLSRFINLNKSGTAVKSDQPSA